MSHENFIQQAIDLSYSAVAAGNHPFGALLVRHGEVLLTAENTIYTGHDVTNHAEMNLVRLAVQKYSFEFLNECILYTSTEPCAMCSGAIYWSGIGSVVYSCSAEKLGEIAGKHLAISCREIFERGERPVKVDGPIMQEIAAALHLTYWKL